MVKHIIMMSIYQASIILIIIFAGEKFIPEDPRYIPRHGRHIGPGRLYNLDGSPLYKRYRDGSNDPGPSRQFTIVFTTFILMQVFNLLNSRKINDECNIFSRIFRNPMFIMIWILILLIQVSITQYGQDIIDVNREGLFWKQWIIGVIFGVSVIPVSFFIRTIPDSIICGNRSRVSKSGYTQVEEDEVINDSDLLRSQNNSDDHYNNNAVTYKNVNDYRNRLN